jgi:RNA polymerase sigma factor (sigma-70 family)
MDETGPGIVPRPVEHWATLPTEPSMSTPDITQLLDRMNSGDDTALDELMGVVYSELKRTAKGIADKRSRPGGGDNTLGPTALVNEFYIQMNGRVRSADRPEFKSLNAFFGYAATAITNKLIERAESTVARERRERVSAAFEKEPGGNDEFFTREVTARLGPILDEMRSLRPDLSRVFEMRFALDMEFLEIAERLGLTPARARGDWLEAKEFIRERLRDLGDAGATGR